jgi:hypothetical protein
MYVTGLLIFVLGSALAAPASGTGLLIAARVVQPGSSSVGSFDIRSAAAVEVPGRKAHASSGSYTPSGSAGDHTPR